MNETAACVNKNPRNINSCSYRAQGLAMPLNAPHPNWDRMRSLPSSRSLIAIIVPARRHGVVPTIEPDISIWHRPDILTLHQQAGDLP